MASIEERHVRGQDRFLVRYRDPSGKQKARTFKSRKEAADYEAEVRTDMRRGAYLDPQAGQMKVKPWAEKWLAAQGHLKPSTKARLLSRLDPQIGPPSAPVLDDPPGRSDHLDQVRVSNCRPIECQRKRGALKQARYRAGKEK
jgi:hypothetical protein